MVYFEIHYFTKKKEFQGLASIKGFNFFKGLITQTTLVLGSTGQDGSLISKSLLQEGHKVLALTRGNSQKCENFRKLGIHEDIINIQCDLTSFSALTRIIHKYSPENIFNLACQSSVGKSFSVPRETTESIYDVSLNLLEASRALNYQGKIFFAGSSEMFGEIKSKANIYHPQNPKSPYAIAKQASYNLVKLYREIYDLKCMTGILFNHESNLRPETFVIPKIIKTAYQIRQGQASQLEVGNIDIIRDWGWAPEYINAMKLITKSDIVKDHIICTGNANSLKTLIEKVFKKFGLEWKEFTSINKKYYRKTDIQRSCGDPEPIFNELGWRAKIDIDTIIEKMISY
tara:strand:- start:6756 stop:7787 length:1032 start_codon:yes stop_codon:yes gene_type:complete